MNQFSLFNLQKIKYAFICCIVCIISPLAFAETISQESPSQEIEPEITSSQTTINDKPISIDADNQQIDIKNNTITFTGNVVILQDGLNIKANTVVITNMQSKDNQVITAYGKPVLFEKVTDNNPNQTVKGHSNQLVYNVKSNNVVLTGKAELFQQDNHISSDIITYNIKQKKIQAQSQKGNRVKTTIIPNQAREINQ